MSENQAYRQDSPYQYIVDTCKMCGGSGVSKPTLRPSIQEWGPDTVYIYHSGMEGPLSLPQQPSDCRCLGHRNTMNRMSRNWAGLDKAPNFESGHWGELEPQHLEENLIIVGNYHERGIVQSHFKQLLLSNRLGDMKWSYRVTSDADLINAQFANMKAKSAEIFDQDVVRAPIGELTLEDETVPWDLLIVLIGVKGYRNKSTSEAVLEALRLRRFRGKPTWFVFESVYDTRHEAYSEEVQEHIKGWSRIDLRSEEEPSTQEAPSDSSLPEGVTPMISQSSLSKARAVPLNQAPPKSEKRYSGKNRKHEEVSE